MGHADTEVLPQWRAVKRGTQGRDGHAGGTCELPETCSGLRVLVEVMGSGSRIRDFGFLLCSLQPAALLPLKSG